MTLPIFRETEKSSDYQVVNAIGTVAATFSEPDLAFGFVAADDGARGPLHVEHVVVLERRRMVRRLRAVA